MDFRELSLGEKLLIVRDGTALFAQRLADISDDALKDDTLLDGWTRKHLVAHLGYNAAALCRLLDWAVTGVETPMYASADQRSQQIAEGATLSTPALRTFFDHNAARLDQKWRDMPTAAWDAPVRTAQGRTVTAAETTWMRTREVWIHAVDLDNGAQFGDFPDIVLETLLADIVGSWRDNGLGGDLTIQVIGSEPLPVGDRGSRVVRGTLPAVVRWAAGRGEAGITSDGPTPEPPRWL